MKRVLAILFFVPFVMALAPPCHAAGNGEVTVSLVDIPAELQERSVLITLGSSPNDTDAVLVVLNGLNQHSQTVTLSEGIYYCNAAVQYDALNDWPLREVDGTTFLQVEAGGQYELQYEFAGESSKSKIYAASAHNLQACRTYKSVWLECASKPLAQKDTFYKQNEAALQAYSRAASQLDKMGISQLVEPEKIQRLISETENRITELVAELEKVQNADNGIQEDKERVKQIQSNEINGTYSAFSRA